VSQSQILPQTLLREKDINPLLPWDTCLPQFVSDPRYTLLSSVAVRREAFDEFCRDRARELRQSSLKKEKRDANPVGEYDRLLREEVKSTRASWTDFRRVWKKDRRFYGWGRDDREREKRFKEYLRELGERMLSLFTNLFVVEPRFRKTSCRAESRSEFLCTVEGTSGGN
jgi:hypothetical protein